MKLPAGTFNYKYFADWQQEELETVIRRSGKGKVLAQLHKQSEFNLSNE